MPVRANGHGAEFVEAEQAAMPTDTLTTVEDRARRVEGDQEGDQNKKRAEQCQTRQRRDQIEQAAQGVSSH